MVITVLIRSSKTSDADDEVDDQVAKTHTLKFHRVEHIIENWKIKCKCEKLNVELCVGWIEWMYAVY